MTEGLFPARRRVMAWPFLGAGLAFGTPRAGAAEPSRLLPGEEANIALVTHFCEAWSSRDVEQLIPFVAETLEYHVNEGGMVINGPAQLRERMGPFMAGMQTIRWEIFRSAALGDIVINDRIDHFLRPPGSGKADNHFAVTGVFLVRGGKIHYWMDYRAPERKA